MSISNQLKELYLSRSENIKNLLKHPKYSTDNHIHEGPFLINPWDENYKSSKYKIMIIGKQTEGWTWEENTAIEPETLINNSLYLYNCYKNASGDTGRMFWRAFYQILSGLQENPDRLSAIWGNLWKYDQYNYAEEKVFSPTPAFREAIISNFNILQKEIEICDPDAIIFFTSKHFDYDLDRQLNGIKFEAFNEDYSAGEFSKCIHSSLPLKAYRTYHPDYLLHYRPKHNAERYSNVIDLIIKDIQSSCVTC